MVKYLLHCSCTCIKSYLAYFPFVQWQTERRGDRLPVSKQAGMNMLEEGLILSYSIICTSTVLLFVVIIAFLKSKADEKRTVRDKIQERRLQLRHYLSIVFSIHRFLSEHLSII